MLTALIEERIEMNGTALKKLARERYGISKHDVDKFLENFSRPGKVQGKREDLLLSGPSPRGLGEISISPNPTEWNFGKSILSRWWVR